MPTNLPVRSSVQTRSDDRVRYRLVLLRFYGSLGLALLLLFAAEMRLGMFDGLMVTESIVNLVGIQSLESGIDPNWASSPPL